MLVVAVFVTTVTARPDSAGIVEMVNGLAYGKITLLLQHYLILSFNVFADNAVMVLERQFIFKFSFTFAKLLETQLP